MKLSFVASLTSAELNAIREAEYKAHEMFSSMPNIGKFFTPGLLESKMEVFSKGFDIKYKRFNNIHNFLYMINMKDTLEVEVTLNVSKEVLELYIEMQQYYASLALPVVDSIAGVIMSMSGKEIKATSKSFEKRLEAMKGKTNTAMKVTHGDAVEIDFNSENEEQDEKQAEVKTEELDNK